MTTAPLIDPEAETEVLQRPETFEDHIALALFWGLGFVVFLQFFTRYVLNSSLG